MATRLALFATAGAFTPAGTARSPAQQGQIPSPRGPGLTLHALQVGTIPQQKTLDL